MRLARKLFLLGAMALAALALSAGSAFAQETPLEVAPETGTEECGTVTEVGGHDVVGGCHVEFSAESVPLWAHIPGETPVSNCRVFFEAQIGEDGEGFVTTATLTAATEGPAVPCSRTPCDEAEGSATPHADLLWPIHLVEHGPDAEEVEANFCLRVATNQEGQGNAFCEVHLPLVDGANEHEYVISDETHQFCEVSPQPFPVSITGDIRSVVDGENIEIIHHPAG